MSLRFLTRYTLSLSIMAGCLILPAVGWTAPSFTSDEEKTLGILPSYSLCMKQTNGNVNAALNCDDAELDYQGWRYDEANKALMKKLTPVEQKTLRQKERNWLKKRNTLCDGKPGLSCQLRMITQEAVMLENMLKEKKKENKK